MATEVERLRIAIEADLSGVKKSLKELDGRIQKTQQTATKRFGQLGTVIKAGFAAVAVRELSRAAMQTVEFASHVEEMQAKSSVVFGQFTEAVRKELAEFGKEVGRSRFELEEMAASVQDTFVPMGFARGEAADLSVQLAKLATDVASFNNASDAETMRAFQSALVGNHETVRRFGIVITEAELQAELFRMGINKSKDEITAAEKVQARLNLILAGTTDAQGDAARTAESYANQVKAMQAELDILAANIGGVLMPVFKSVVGVIRESAEALNDFFGNEEMNFDSLAEGQKTFEENQKKINALQKQLNEDREAYNKLFRVGEGEAAAAKRYMENANALRELNEQQDAVVAGIKKLGDAQRAAEDVEQVEKEKETAAAQKKVRDAIDEVRRANELLRLELEGSSDVRIAQQEVANQLKQTFEELDPTLKQHIADQVNMKKKIEQTGNSTKFLKDKLQEAGDKLSQDLAAAFMSGENAMESFKNVAAQVVQEVLAHFLKLLVIQPIINAMTGMFGGGGSVAPADNSAGGGTVAPRRPVLVGERGPELFIPSGAGTVMNNMNTKNALGGGSPVVINQSINVETGVAQTVRAEMLSFLPIIRDQSINAVSQAKRRGGQLAADLA